MFIVSGRWAAPWPRPKSWPLWRAFRGGGGGNAGPGFSGDSYALRVHPNECDRFDCIQPHPRLGHSLGATISDTKNEEYLRKQASGADLLAIPFAHTLAAVCDVLGGSSQLSANVHTRYPRVKVLDMGTYIEADAPDYISVIASLTNSAPFSIEYTGGPLVYGDAFSWQIEGTRGQLVMTGSTGHTQLAN